MATGERGSRQRDVQSPEEEEADSSRETARKTVKLERSEEGQNSRHQLHWADGEPPRERLCGQGSAFRSHSLSLSHTHPPAHIHTHCNTLSCTLFSSELRVPKKADLKLSNRVAKNMKEKLFFTEECQLNKFRRNAGISKLSVCNPPPPRPPSVIIESGRNHLVFAKNRVKVSGDITLTQSPSVTPQNIQLQVYIFQ